MWTQQINDYALLQGSWFVIIEANSHPFGTYALRPEIQNKAAAQYGNYSKYIVKTRQF